MNIAPPQVQIAVLLTCFNRKDKTLQCLENLKNQELPDNVKITIFLVDDGSTDGTSDAVSQAYADIVLVQGQGNLYWNQGMRLAWNTALQKQNFDYFLLLNDDTELFFDAISRLMDVESSVKKETASTGIIVGSTIDPDTKQFTYGGNDRVIGLLGKGFRFRRVAPSDEPKVCDTFNANCVLISNDIVNVIGVLSEQFTHAMGDYDYGLRALEKGYLCWIVPGYIGTCPTNDAGNTWLDPNLSLKKRGELRNSPKGMPTDEWLYFVKRHAGYMWLLAWLQLNLRLYFPRAWSLLRKLRNNI